MTYSVILNRVLVKKEESEDGFFVEGDNMIRGRVLGVGSGLPEEPMTIKVNDVVLFDISRSNKLPFEPDVFVIEQKSVLAIENEN